MKRKENQYLILITYNLIRNTKIDKENLDQQYQLNIFNIPFSI